MAIAGAVSTAAVAGAERDHDDRLERTKAGDQAPQRPCVVGNELSALRRGERLEHRREDRGVDDDPQALGDTDGLVSADLANGSGISKLIPRRAKCLGDGGVHAGQGSSLPTGDGSIGTATELLATELESAVSGAALGLALAAVGSGTGTRLDAFDRDDAFGQFDLTRRRTGGRVDRPVGRAGAAGGYVSLHIDECCKVLAVRITMPGSGSSEVLREPVG